MKAVILAGGLRACLAEEAGNKPKAMFELAAFYSEKSPS